VCQGEKTTICVVTAWIMQLGWDLRILGMLKAKCRCGTPLGLPHKAIPQTPPPFSADRRDRNVYACMKWPANTRDRIPHIGPEQTHCGGCRSQDSGK